MASDENKVPTTEEQNRKKKKIAVVFGTLGGMSDCGKFAAVHSKRLDDVESVIVPLAHAPSGEPTDKAQLDVDVTYPDGKANLIAEFEKLEWNEPLDVTAEGTQARLEEHFDGCSAVVAAIGNRQPFMARWCALGAEKIVAAMKKKDVPRLIVVGSMGIGEDYEPAKGFYKHIWTFFTKTLCRSAVTDILAMESVLEKSDRDYLLVKAMGLYPAAPPQGKWALRTAAGQGLLGRDIPKSDMGLFMVQQATNPTYHRQIVVIGQEPQ